MHETQGFKDSGFKVGEGFQEKAAQRSFQFFQVGDDNSYEQLLTVLNYDLIIEEMAKLLNILGIFL